MKDTKIQWATHTFNPWRGCQKIAPGCANCYADKLSKRNPGTLGVWGPNGTRVVASEAMWAQPLKWDREAQFAWEYWQQRVDKGKPAYQRPRVFCASLADVFEDWQNIMRSSRGMFLHHADKWQKSQGGSPYVEIADIAIGKSRVVMADVRRRLFDLIDNTQNLDWLLLTKRPENVARMIPPRTHRWDRDGERCLDCGDKDWMGGQCSQNTARNLWLGTSIATQEDADRNIPELLKCRNLAAKLFLSIEPLIGPVDLSQWLNCYTPAEARRLPFESRPWFAASARHTVTPDWVIVGGESGPNARPLHPDWARSIRDQCQAAGVPFFFKQWGAWTPFDSRIHGLGDPRKPDEINGYPVLRVPTGPPRLEQRMDRFGRYDYRLSKVAPVLRQYVEPIIRVGKKAAGRLLDGREWSEVPT